MSKSKQIRVSFKGNEVESQLYDDILLSSQLMGQSAWMKMAAMEKLKGNPNDTQKRSNSRQYVKPNDKVISSVDDLFK